jgi:reverse gyrase
MIPQFEPEGKRENPLGLSEREKRGVKTDMILVEFPNKKQKIHNIWGLP